MVDMVHGNGRGTGILRRDVMEALSHKLAREVDLIHFVSPALLSSKYTFSKSYFFMDFGYDNFDHILWISVSFSSPVMRVLNDVWAQLSGIRLAAIVMHVCIKVV